MTPSSSTEAVWSRRLYAARWPLTALVLVAIALTAWGASNRHMAFSTQVDTLQDTPPEQSEAKPFDARYDIWFDPEDPGLLTYKDIEDQFVAEDFVLVAFEEREHPLGVFSPKALETIAKVTKGIEQVPYIRHVRSLTSNPWIRWDTIGENPETGEVDEGLLITDLFEGDPTQYSEQQVLERIVGVMGAEKAANLVGEDKVRQVIGQDTPFEDVIGEPRLLGNVISADGRTAAFQLLVLRPRIEEETMTATFGDDAAVHAVGRGMHANWAQWNALHEAEDLLAEVAKDSPYEFHLAGMPLVERNFMETGEADLGMTGWMFLMIILVMLVLFRRVAAMVTPMVIIISSLVGMMGTIFLMGDLLNNITAGATNMVTAIAIADAIHLIAAYYGMRYRFSDKHTLIVEVVRRNAMPVFLTTVTTAVGFFSLTAGNIIPLQMLGYTAGIGTLFAYITSMTVVPAVLSLLPLPKPQAGEDVSIDDDEARPTGERDNHWSTPLLDWVLRRRKPIAIGSLAVTLLAVFGVFRLHLDSDFRTMFPDTNVVMADLNWIESRLGGTGDLEIVFEAPATDESKEQVAGRQERIEELRTRRAGSTELPDLFAALSAEEAAELTTLETAEASYQRRRIGVNAAFLDKLRAFNDRLRKEMRDENSPLRVVTRLDGALDILRKMHQVQNENRAEFYRTPNEADVNPVARTEQFVYDDFTEEGELTPAQNASTLAAQYFLQYENGAKPAENLATLISPDRRMFRVQGRIEQASSLTQQAAFDRIREIAAAEFPELAGTADQVKQGEAMATMTLSGKTLLYAGMSDKFAKSFIFSMIVALSIITILIGLIYRSFNMGLLSIVPNVLPIFIPIGFFGLLGWELDGPAVFVSSVALGICVDDTIHFFTKFTRARKRGLETEQAVRAAFHEVGNALTFTTLILVLGFSVLAFSEFSPNSMMGKLAALMIGLAWVADFVVTPALLTFLPSSHTSPSDAAATPTTSSSTPDAPALT